jgi:hypothetical protein
MNHEAEAEIERLCNEWLNSRDVTWVGQLRAAMLWAYKDAAYICRKGPFLADRQDCAVAIEARAREVG